MRHKFNDILSLVLAERKNSYKSLRTADWEKKMSHKVYEYFENKYVEDVDDVVLTNFFSFCRRKENGELYSDKYIKELYSLVNGTLKKAFAKGYIPCNPLDYGVKRPKGAVPNAQNRLVSEEDLALLLNAVQKNPRFKVMIPVLLLTGMRIGELLGLYWSDIDFDHGIISIRRAVSDSFTELPSGEIVKSGVTITSTKTTSSDRDIAVCNDVLRLFREWLDFRDNPENTSWRKKIEKNDNLNLVFPNYHGKLMSYKTIADSLKDFLKTEHLERCGVLFHKLRHNYATDLLSAGVDIAVVSALLGHKDIQTTANIYVKVQLDPKLEAVKLQENYLHKKAKI